MFLLYIKYDDFFDGDDELVYLTQVAEIESRIAQPDNTVNSTPFQTITHHPNNKTNKPNFSVPNNKNIETKNRVTSSAKQTKISHMLAPSTSKTPHSSVHEPPRNHNDIPVKKQSVLINQATGKRVASSPVHAEFKRPSVKFHNPEDIWDDIVMDVDISNPLIKVLKSASVVKYSKIQVKQTEWICSGTVLDDDMSEKEVELSSEVSYKH